ncbi:MAG: amidase [Woeseiaceae bacterium]|nr:amidase [Woeseiaceae bacterium]
MVDTKFTRRAVLGGLAAGTLLAGLRPRAQSDDLVELSIAESARLMAAGTLTSVALTRAYLDRIERLEPTINAFITVTAATAMAEAEMRDAERTAGNLRGPLHGIPIALKDNIDTAGVLTSAASAIYANRVPPTDAECVSRLRAAGAVFLGKTNMHEFAFGGSSADSHYGPVRNPWNPDYIPGGSSGGSGAAVAARMCAAALGTDTAASVRNPAAHCGVTGLKATYGLASIRGIVPLSESVDHVGPITRSAEDAALMLGAIAGYDPRDVSSIDVTADDYPAAIGRNVSGLRVGVLREQLYPDVHAEVAAAADAAADVLASLVSDVSDATMPLPAFEDSLTIIMGDILAYHAEFLADPTTRALYQPGVMARFEANSDVPLDAYIKARSRMLVARKTIHEAFSDFDVFIAPTVAMPAHRIEDALNNPPDELLIIRNTIHFNTLGNPVISTPCGFTSDGLPIGLQIIGPPLGESRVLALAHAYENATQWSDRRAPPTGKR